MAGDVWWLYRGLYIREALHTLFVDDDVRESFPFTNLRCLQNHVKGWLNKLLHIAHNCA